MSTETLDTTPTTATPEPATGADKVPAGTPAPDTGQHLDADTDDLDLLADDVDGGESEGEDADGTRAEGKAGEADAERPVPAWQRPADLAGPDADPDAVAEWKERQGLPTDADGYQINLELKEGEQVSEVGQQLLDGLKEVGVENDLSAPALNAIAKFYKTQLQQQEVRLAEADKTLQAETRDALTERWGDSYAERMEVAKEGARVLPQGLRQALKVARLPDGTRLAHTADFAQALFEIGRLRTKGNTTVPPSDEARLTEINKIRDTNIDRYERENLSKEALDIMRRVDAAKSPRTPGTLTAAEAEEERALVQLMSEDVGTYQQRQWRGLGVTGSDRLLQLRRKRDGVAA